MSAGTFHAQTNPSPIDAKAADSQLAAGMQDVSNNFMLC